MADEYMVRSIWHDGESWACCEFVCDLWQNSGDTQRMDIETAAGDLENYRADGWDIPDGLTPELYAELWNRLVDSQET